MNSQNSASMQDLLDIFNDSISPAEAVTAKLISQVTSSIVAERLRLNMKQSDFAKRIGVSQSQISQWEKGTYNFSLKKISEIFSALDLNVDITISKPSEVVTSDETFTPIEQANNIIRFPARTSTFGINIDSDIKEM